MSRINILNFVYIIGVIGVAVSLVCLFVFWEHRDEYVLDGGHYGCIYSYFAPKIDFNSTISKRYRKPRNRSNCTPVKPQNVDLLGVVLVYHKAGTVLHNEFYQSICAWMGINYVKTDLSASDQLQHNSYHYWMHSQSSKMRCQDYHKCNDRALIYTNMDVIKICLSSGVKCDDWQDIECFVSQCSNLLKISPQLKILNLVRNPFDLVISAYLYHSGDGYENWAKEMSLRQLGYSLNDEINNLTLTEALNSQNAEIGLEICFQVVSDVLKGMSLMKNLEKKGYNIKSFKFEEIVGEFDNSMFKELEFLGFFRPGDLESDKLSVIKYGQWVMSDTHKKDLQKNYKHFTSDQKTSKKYLKSILYKHSRAEQLHQIAELLGYNNIDYQS